MLGEMYDERKACFDSLRTVYGPASSVPHARYLKRKNREVDAGNGQQGPRSVPGRHTADGEGGGVPNRDEIAQGTRDEERTGCRVDSGCFRHEVPGNRAVQSWSTLRRLAFDQIPKWYF